MPNLARLLKLAAPRTSPVPFIPSTNASIVSTPATGAATKTGRYSNELPYGVESTGVCGGVSVCWVDDEPENLSAGTAVEADGSVLVRGRG